MGKNLTALKKIYAKMGGTEDDSGVTRNAEELELIADKVEDVILPAVGTNGQVMTTVSGEWKAANLPT